MSMPEPDAPLPAPELEASVSTAEPLPEPDVPLPTPEAASVQPMAQAAGSLASTHSIRQAPHAGLEARRPVMAAGSSAAALSAVNCAGVQAPMLLPLSIPLPLPEYAVPLPLPKYAVPLPLPEYALPLPLPKYAVPLPLPEYVVPLPLPE